MIKVKPLKSYTGKLSASDAAKGIQLATINANELITDAEILYENDRFPRASSLAILAIEEVGKINLYRSLTVETDPKRIKLLWKAMRSHRKKNVMWLLPNIVAKGNSKLEDLKFLFEENSGHTLALDILKQLGFYTHINPDKDWLLPENIITKDLAFEHLDYAKALCPDSNSIEWNEDLLSIWIIHMRPELYNDIESGKKALRNFFGSAFDAGLISEKHAQMVENIL